MQRHALGAEPTPVGIQFDQSLPRDLPAHLQRPTQYRLYLRPGLVAPGGRGDGPDQEQDANPREEVRHSLLSSAWARP